MTDRPHRWRLAVGLAVTALCVSGCGDDPDRAADPSSSPTSSEPTLDPSESGEGATGEPCDAIDTAALGDLAGVQLGPAEPYHDGPSSADGCFVASKDGELSITVDIRSRHGSLEKDLQYVGALGNEEARATSVAEGEGLVISGEQSGVDYSGVVTHVGDLLLAVGLQNFFVDDLTPEQGEQLVTSLAEMVAPVI